jgi:hypothetical protein
MMKSWPALQKIKGKKVYARPGMTTSEIPRNQRWPCVHLLEAQPALLLFSISIRELGLWEALKRVGDTLGRILL